MGYSGVESTLEELEGREPETQNGVRTGGGCTAPPLSDLCKVSV